MASRRPRPTWTDIETKELYDLMGETRRRLSRLQSHAPIHSPLYDEISKTAGALVELHKMVGWSGMLDPHHPQRVALDPEMVKPVPLDQRPTRRGER